MQYAIIESPYAGDVEANVAYARDCMRDSILRGEVPFAGHLLFTQVLDDADPQQRSKGIRMHLAIADAIVECCVDIGIHPNIGEHSVVMAVYTDRGISPGMQQGIEYASKKRVEVQFRTLACE